jgi:carbon monoxide dehydrogenase subunit G
VIVGEGTAVIRRPPRDVLEFVLDPERYRQADTKIEETAEGTRVHHREAVSLRPPLAWVMEPLLRDWLARDTAQEMARMKALLEA